MSHGSLGQETYSQTCTTSVPESLAHLFQAGQLVRTEEQHATGVAGQMAHYKLLRGAVRIKPPCHIRYIPAPVILSPRSVLRPQAGSSAGQSNLPRTPNLVAYLGAANNRNLVPAGPGTQA